MTSPTEWLKEDVPRGSESATSGCAISGRAIAGVALPCGCEDVPNSIVLEVDLSVTGTIEVIADESD